MIPQVCLEDDEFVREAFRWVVDLSNGDTVYQDDGRPGVTPEQAWVRLKEYCRQKSARIVRMRVQFGPNVVWLPEAKDGYFFVKCAVAVWGQPETYHAIVAGYQDGDVVRTTKYRVPDLTVIGGDTRRADPSSPLLISVTGLTEGEA